MRPGSMPTRDESGCSLDDRTYLGMYGGIAVYCNPVLAHGVVQLRNPDGEIVATIHNVKQIDTRGR